MVNIAEKARTNEWIPFLRYVIAGVTSVAFQFLLLVFFVEYVAMNATLSSVISFILSSLMNYLLLYYWVFLTGNDHSKVALRFLIISLLALAANGSLFWFLTEIVGCFYFLSQCVATATIALLCYLINKRFIFT